MNLINFRICLPRIKSTKINRAKFVYIYKFYYKKETI